ncbi:MAG: dihydrodipicolinate synthase family protein [Rubrivivax sp.]|nr:dihydrodipicolinate synthase family protein [Rubrivivax sp.]
MINARQLQGVTVATVLPFDEKLAIDWGSYERLLDYCARRPGIVAVFVNGHAGEVATLTPEEREEVIRRTRRFLGPAVPLMAGIVAYGTSEAVARAREAEKAGADVAVLFPFPQYSGGGGADPQAGMRYVEAVRAAVHIPLSIFQYPLRSGAGFSTEVLCRMAQVPGVIAIKEGSGDIAAYEDNWRALKAAAPQVAMLPSNFDWFLPQLAVGADGVLSGLASLLPDLFIELWQATADADLTALRRASDRLYPIERAIYGAAPLMDMHTRIKVALQHLGVIHHALPRPPLMPVAPELAQRLRGVVDAAGLRGPRAG